MKYLNKAIAVTWGIVKAVILQLTVIFLLYLAEPILTSYAILLVV